MPHPFAVLGILVNTLAAAGALAVLLGRGAPAPLEPLRRGPLRPLAVAVAIHWLLYFGPVNLGAVLLESDFQWSFAWVISKPFMAQAALYGLIAYGLVLAALAAAAVRLEGSRFARSWQGLPPAPRGQVILLAVVMVVLAALLAPYVATPGSDAGALFQRVPLFMRPFVKGLVPLEAVPLLAAVHGAHAPPRPAARWSPWGFALVGLLQVTTFILLRQRFLALLAVVLVGVGLLRWLRPLVVGLAVPVALLVAYVIPTALRYRRDPPLPGQPFGEYLQTSFHHFLTGLLPTKLLAAAVTDFSYNKAGMASLSVVLDLRRTALADHHRLLGWVPAEVYRALPGGLKGPMADWGKFGTESQVARALRVASDYRIDMMETPLLDPVSNAGLPGLVLFAVVAALVLGLVWIGFCLLVRRWPFTWILPFGALFVVGQGASWIGELLVVLKVSPPWLLLCAAFALYPRWSHSASTTQRQ